jgi:hypothetical protein
MEIKAKLGPLTAVVHSSICWSPSTLNDKNIFISPGIKPRHSESIREGVIFVVFSRRYGRGYQQF